MKEANPYKVVGPVKLYHFISKQVVSREKSDCILSFLENGSKNYLKFCEERFLKKEKKLADTIKRITAPQFLQKNRKASTENKLDTAKSSLKLLGKAQKEIEIARSRDYPLREILQYDLTRDCPLFDEVGLARHKKHEILKPLESDLQEEGYKLNRNDDFKTVVVVDFMSMIRKVPFHVHKNKNEALESTWAMILSPGIINQIHFVYDSCLQNSIKESERAHRSDTTRIDVVDLGLEFAIPVDLKSFWFSASNKHQLQIASRKFFQNFSEQNRCDS